MLTRLGIIAAVVVIVFLCFQLLRNRNRGVPAETDEQTQPSLPPRPTLSKLLADAIKDLTTVEVLTYEEAIKYFITHKKDNPANVKGAMLKTKEDGSFCVTQVFLDKDDNIVCRENGTPLGRKLKIARLDEELLNAFKNNDLVFVR